MMTMTSHCRRPTNRWQRHPRFLSWIRATTSGTNNNNTTNNNNSDPHSQWEYGLDDAADDPEKHRIVEAEAGLDAELQAYYDAIPEEEKGSGWFDQRMKSFHTPVDTSATKKFLTVPRAWDRAPANVPANHPLRAIASLLHYAAPDSTIRIFCYSLTDPMALDLIIHHANQKIIKVIINPDQYTISKIQEFLRRFERYHSWDVFYARLQVRVADTTSPPCSRYSSMHDKRVITQQYSTYGSYNLSCAARFANREAIALLATDETEIDDFDGLWNQLEHRKLDAVYSDFYPPEFRVPKHPRTT